MIGATRIHGTAYRESIGVAIDVIGPTIMARLPHLQFVAGVDPLFAGLHDFANANNNRSYRNTAHCCYPLHLVGPRDRRVTTVVLPARVHPFIVVHEIGHAVHESLGFEPILTPVTDYAKLNHYEAFAEAFVRFVWPHPSYLPLDEEARTVLGALT